MSVRRGPLAQACPDTLAAHAPGARADSLAVGRSLQEGGHSHPPNPAGRPPAEDRLEAPSRRVEPPLVARRLEVLREGHPLVVLHPEDALPEAPNHPAGRHPAEAPNHPAGRHPAEAPSLQEVHPPADRSRQVAVPSPTSRGAGPG